MLLDDDVALWPQILPQVPTCLIVENLLRFLLMLLAATTRSVGIGGEIRSEMARGHVAHLLRARGLMMTNGQIVFADGIVSRGAHVVQGSS